MFVCRYRPAFQRACPSNTASTLSKAGSDRWTIRWPEVRLQGVEIFPSLETNGPHIRRTPANSRGVLPMPESSGSGAEKMLKNHEARQPDSSWFHSFSWSRDRDRTPCLAHRAAAWVAAGLEARRGEGDCCSLPSARFQSRTSRPSPRARVCRRVRWPRNRSSPGGRGMQRDPVALRPGPSYRRCKPPRSGRRVRSEAGTQCRTSDIADLSPSLSGLQN